MSQESPTDRPSATALAEAAAAAQHAPTVHDARPWRWQVLPDALELRTASDRRLAATDPEGRLLAIGCGAALHHARVALAAEGWTPVVERLPDPGDPELLARLSGLRRTDPDPDATRLVRCMPARHADHRPVSDEPVPTSAIGEITRAVAAEGGRLQILDGDQAAGLAGAVARAGAGEATDGGAAAYALLYGDEDEPDSWLRGGEALSAAWLTATRLGVAVAPVRGVVEVEGARQALRGLLGGLGFPYLVLRLGIADRTAPGAPPAPRPAGEQVVDTSAVRGEHG
ncbi:nitroreductase [Micromonospora sp. URMC 103]|uniref:nitroreductase n=1 Tax=Micromonospora sp. URMC 103 TaxID=3423406 RepID=UPI003F1D84E9